MSSTMKVTFTILVLNLVFLPAAKPMGRYKNKVIGYDCANLGSIFPRLSMEKYNYCKNNVPEKNQKLLPFGIEIESNANILEDCPFKMCETMENYPTEIALDLIRRNPSFHSYFGNVIEPEKFVGNRFNEGESNPYCMVREVIKFPRQMKDIEHIERIIVNNIEFDNKIFQQGVKYETCVQGEVGSFCYAQNPLDYKSTCIQKFNIISLLTVGLNSDVMEYRRFKVPSTCVCMYVKDM